MTATSAIHVLDLKDAIYELLRREFPNASYKEHVDGAQAIIELIGDLSEYSCAVGNDVLTVTRE